MNITYNILLHLLNKQANATGGKVLEELDVKGRKKIVDVGCGGGYFSYQFAKGNTTGTIFALDVDQRHLDFVVSSSNKKRIKNITPVLVEPECHSLPFGKQEIDMFFLRNVFHDIQIPTLYFTNLKNKLTRNGIVVIIEFLPNDRFVEGRTGHCTSEEKIHSVMEEAGFCLKSTFHFLKPKQSFNIYHAREEFKYGKE